MFFDDERMNLTELFPAEGLDELPLATSIGIDRPFPLNGPSALQKFIRSFFERDVLPLLTSNPGFSAEDL
jgi:hypothetical protein